MKYAVTVNGVTLDEVNRIIKTVSAMGFGVPRITEAAEKNQVADNTEKRRRHGQGIVLKNNGMKFISLREATDWLRKSCNVTCSGGSLKRAIESGMPYMGFEFLFDDPWLLEKGTSVE